MVPRSILKNGKRDRAYLDASRSLTLAAPGPPESRTLTEAPEVTVSDEVRYTTMKKELNSLMFSCARQYNLQKASDSLEYSVLLERLFEVGFNGKLWRLVKNWYEEVSSYVKIDG